MMTDKTLKLEKENGNVYLIERTAEFTYVIHYQPSHHETQECWVSFYDTAAAVDLAIDYLVKEGFNNDNKKLEDFIYDL